MSEEVSTETAPVKVLGRDDLRAQIFNSGGPKKKIVKFFGVDIELHQPMLGDILKNDDKAGREVMIDSLIRHAYVPGTDEHVFTEEDADQLKNLPFTEDFTLMLNALNEMTKVNFPK